MRLKEGDVISKLFGTEPQYMHDRWRVWIVMPQIAAVGAVVGWLFYANVWAALFCAIVSQCALPMAISDFKRRSDQRVLDDFSDLTLWVTAGFQTGRTLESILASFLKEWRLNQRTSYRFIGHELILWEERLQLGVKGIELFRQLAESTHVVIVRQFSDLLQCSLSHGGSSIDVIHKFNQYLREERLLAKEVEVVTSQKKMEHLLVSIAPLGFLLYLQGVAQSFISPLYDTVIGRILMSVSMVVFIGLVNIVVIRKGNCSPEPISIVSMNRVEELLLRHHRILSGRKLTYLRKQLHFVSFRLKDVLRWIYPVEQVGIVCENYLHATIVLLAEALVGIVIMIMFSLPLETAVLLGSGMFGIAMYPIMSAYSNSLKSKAEFLKEFVFMIQYFAVLSGVGLHPHVIYRHWRSQEHKASMLTQLKVIDRECQRGLSFYEAWVSWQNIVDSRGVKRFVGLMVQGTRHGLRDLSQGFWQIAGDETQYEYLNIKRNAEKISTKLLMPMMISLIVLLIILAYPAMRQLTVF